MATVDGTDGKDFIHVAGDGLIAPIGYNDMPLATDGEDIITPNKGIDIVFAGDGTDTLNFESRFRATDQVDGGAGTDTLQLDGDYTDVNAVVLAANTLVNVEKILLADGNSYNLTSNDATVAANATLVVDASPVITGRLIFDGSAETDGHFTFFGSQGNDLLYGGGKFDVFNLTQGGFDYAYGGAGGDTFNMGATMSVDDIVDGGAGIADTVILDGDYTGVNALAFNTFTLKNVETLKLTTGHGYSLTFSSDQNVAAGRTLLIDGSTLGAADGIYVLANAESDGQFSIQGGAGNDEFHLGSGGLTTTNAVDGGDGIDTLWLTGGYEAGIVFNANTLTDVEKLYVTGSNEQRFTLDDNTIAAGHNLAVTRFTSTSADNLWLDASAETDGSLSVQGGAGYDTVLGGAQNDIFAPGAGGDENFQGGFGDDTFDFNDSFTQLDTLDGGQGYDKLRLDGDYSAGVNLIANTITHVEEIDVLGGHDYELVMNDANVEAGATLKVDASALGSGNALTFVGIGETDDQFTLVGGNGNDSLTSGAKSDVFILNNGGSDTASGGGGDDLFSFVANGGGLDATDKVDGGAGNDTLELLGISAPVVFNATTMVNVETLTIDAGASAIVLTTNDATIAAGATLAVSYNSTDVADYLYLDGTAETNGNFSVLGAAGSDNIKTGGGADTLNLFKGGNDDISTGAGSDLIAMGGSYTSNDHIDGGSGTDTVSLSGNYTLTFNQLMLSNVEVLSLSGRPGQAKFTLTMSDLNVAAGAQLKVDATLATWLNFNGVAETNGRYAVLGSSGADTIVTGLGNDSLKGGLGRDDLSGKSGNDIFVYGAVSESTGQGRDLLRDFIASSDKFDLNVSVTGIDTAVTTGALHDSASFASDLASAVGAAKLAAHHAVLFTADSGDLSGHRFLVVDANGTAGFQAGADYVMEINNPGIFGTLTTANFI